MQFEKTDKVLNSHKVHSLYFALLKHLVLPFNSNSNQDLTISVMSFLSIILPTLIYCDIAGSMSSNITQSGQCYALL